ncbi:putative bacteriocin export ABC transporter [Lachnospira sp.]|jgi:putative ABC transport system ATP-binding protein|uniref:putative bacteriocin export ABC transporter n=1 Tax=Lachnospira sp. TaxID=2049031 RepID=UPI00257DEE09|nr:putative bacteriocin export ABC transporter [Lachnospira sp.]
MDEILLLKGISKKYDNNEVLSGVNLSVMSGDMIAIVGESGRGKTTLLNILGLIINPSDGEYLINGKQIKNIDSREAMMIRRNYIGYLFQNYGLVEDETVEWNIKLAFSYKKMKNKEKNDEVLFYLQKFGLENSLKKKVYQLSGGEQQRVALIRLMIKDTPIILADEPTGSLDKNNRDLIMEELIKFNKTGKTIIIVTHDNEVANMCKRKIDLR